MRKQIYMDHAAATYLLPEVERAMKPFGKYKFGNPSSLYKKGREAKFAIEQSRKKIAAILDCSPEEIIFEGSGTESINHALIGTAFANSAHGKHIIASAIEHHAVLHSLEFLESQGFEVLYLPVNKEGLLNLNLLKQSIRHDTILISVMYANNEIGVIQPVNEISKIIKQENHQTLFHTDACQAAGYLDMKVDNLGVDLLSANGSKIYGPKGVGLLYVKTGTAILPIIHGGGQENGRRSGTENVAGIAGFAKALELVEKNKLSEGRRLREMRDIFIDGLLKISCVKLNGHASKRLPNNINVSFAGLKGENLVISLDKAGIACSTGSACSSGKADASHVLVALGQSLEQAQSAVRFSLGKINKPKDIKHVLKTIFSLGGKVKIM